MGPSLPPFLRAQPTPQRIELADAVRRLVAEEPRQRLVAQATAGGDGVRVMGARIVGHLFAERHGNRHLRHYGGAAAPDQASIGKEHAGAAARRFDRGIHARGAGADDQHIGVDADRFSRHAAKIERRSSHAKAGTQAAAISSLARKRAGAGYAGSGLPLVSGKNGVTQKPRM